MPWIVTRSSGRQKSFTVSPRHQRADATAPRFWAAAPSLAHEQPPLVVRDLDWDHANYWEKAQKLYVEGHLDIVNRGDRPIKVTCQLRLTLQAVEGDGVRRVRERVPHIWVARSRYVAWKAVMTDWGGKWNMGRGDGSVEIVHCHIDTSTGS